MGLKFFKFFFDNRNFELREMAKDDLALKIKSGFKRFDKKDFMNNLWNKINSEDHNYKVYIYKENSKFIGLIAFDYRKEFYYSDYRDQILDLIKRGRFILPESDMFYLSGIIVQKDHQRKNLGNTLMNFIFYFIKVLKEAFEEKFTFYIFTLKDLYNEFFRNFEWNHRFTFSYHKEDIYVLYKEF